jgi:hypothetical protein
MSDSFCSFQAVASLVSEAKVSAIGLYVAGLAHANTAIKTEVLLKYISKLEGDLKYSSLNSFTYNYIMHRISLGKLGEAQRITQLITSNKVAEAEQMIQEILKKENQIIPNISQLASHEIKPQILSMPVSIAEKPKIPDELTQSTIQAIKAIEQESAVPDDFTLRLVKEAEERYKKMKEDAKASEDLALKLLLEEQAKVQQVKIPAPAASMRPICATCRLEIIGIPSRLNTCMHNFHLDCIRESVRILIEAEEINMKCPAPNCTHPISPADFNSISTAAMRKEYKRILNQPKVEFIKCPGDRCHGRIRKQPGITFQNCPMCRRQFCTECLTSSHPGLTCQQKLQRMFGDEHPRNPAYVNGELRCPSCVGQINPYSQYKYLNCYCGYQFCRDCGYSSADCRCYFCAACHLRPCGC